MRSKRSEVAAAAQELHPDATKKTGVIVQFSDYHK